MPEKKPQKKQYVPDDLTKALGIGLSNYFQKPMQLGDIPKTQSSKVLGQYNPQQGYIGAQRGAISPNDKTSFNYGGKETPSYTKDINGNVFVLNESAKPVEQQQARPPQKVVTNVSENPPTVTMPETPSIATAQVSEPEESMASKLGSILGETFFALGNDDYGPKWQYMMDQYTARDPRSEKSQMARDLISQMNPEEAKLRKYKNASYHDVHPVLGDYQNFANSEQRQNLLSQKHAYDMELLKQRLGARGAGRSGSMGGARTGGSGAYMKGGKYIDPNDPNIHIREVDRSHLQKKEAGTATLLKALDDYTNLLDTEGSSVLGASSGYIKDISKLLGLSPFRI